MRLEQLWRDVGIVNDSSKISEIVLFTDTVGDHMGAAPPVLSLGTSCRDVVLKLRDHHAPLAVVVDGQARVIGVVTDRDITQRVAFRVPPTTPVNEVMTRAPHVVRREDYLFKAIALMQRHGYRRLPVMDENGVCGIIKMSVALAATAPRLLRLIQRLTQEPSLSGLQLVKAAQAELAGTMLESGVGPLDILMLLSGINDDIHRDVIMRVLEDMETQGWGEPPVAFDVLVMGSSGRGENFLGPDQDNGFVLAEYPESERGRVEGFFIELAERMTQDLHQIGFPLCRGHVMATNPLWRKTLPEWRAQLRYWLKKPSAATLRLSDIFFDFRCVRGAGGLTDILRAEVTEQVPRQHRFLAAMQRVQEDHRVALGLFGRLTADENYRHRDQLNLKYHALVPLVEAARLLALKDGIVDLSTSRRISALYQRGRLDSDEHQYLQMALTHLVGLLLREQVARAKADQEVTTYIPLSSLSQHERDLTVEYLKAITRLRERVKVLYSAGLAKA